MINKGMQAKGFTFSPKHLCYIAFIPSSFISSTIRLSSFNLLLLEEVPYCCFCKAPQMVTQWHKLLNLQILKANYKIPFMSIYITCDVNEIVMYVYVT